MRRVHHVDAARFDVEFRFRARETDPPRIINAMRFVLRRRRRKKQKEGHHHRETSRVEEEEERIMPRFCGSRFWHYYRRRRLRRRLFRVTFGRLLRAAVERKGVTKRKVSRALFNTHWFKVLEFRVTKRERGGERIGPEPHNRPAALFRKTPPPPPPREREREKRERVVVVLSSPFVVV